MLLPVCANGSENAEQTRQTSACVVFPLVDELRMFGEKKMLLSVELF